MKRGVVLFAHNNGVTDYYRMAVYTARRANRFLNLPVSIITDESSVSGDTTVFDNVYYVSPDASNYRKKNTWLNKGRYNVYEMTPYDETLVLDTDYMINTPQLLQTFKYSSDFVCHRDTNTLLHLKTQEYLHDSTVQTLWATVMRFRKTSRVKDLFSVMESVQSNYEHYSSVYKFMPFLFRNDYALTIAQRVVNGHADIPQDFLHWKLLHIGLDTTIYRISDTKYLAIKKNTPRADWVYLNDIDFHMIHKQNFEELISE